MERDEGLADCRLNVVRLLREPSADDACRLVVFPVGIGMMGDVGVSAAAIAGEPVETWLARRRDKEAKLRTRIVRAGR